MSTDFRREDMIGRLRSESFDVLVVGGGATGLGVAVDAASRGYRTALVEAEDFAKGTSSRSTKLVHGGVRYLEQLDVSLVIEALRERGLLYRNAPHIVRNLPFVVPHYKWWEGPFYGAGLKAYDLLAGRLNLSSSRRLSAEQVAAEIPNVERDGLRGGIRYHDGQFDDARLAISLALTAADHGAVVVNRCRVTGIRKDVVTCTGAIVQDDATGEEFEVSARVVVNACGIFADEVRRLDDADADPVIEPAQGVHIVLDREFQPSDTAIMVPHTDDGRVLFVIPWHHRVVVGTTDTPMPEAQLEPRPLPDEVEFILRNANRYLARDPGPEDVKSVFAGQRPLVHAGGRNGPTKSISRNHEVFVSSSGVVTIVGGKWTTYRKMAEDTMKHVVSVGGFEERPCITESLQVHGAMERDDPALPAHDPHRMYGSDAPLVAAIAEADPDLAAPLHPDLPYTGAEVAFAVRHEMAFDLDDVLSRRTRSILIDAAAAAAVAPRVASIMAAELGRDQGWIDAQVDSFTALAEGYRLGG
ncbi:MAG: glycerol-3-phosphate dehydrogenase/oxidase [Planctomycetota bacterium]|nr:glycerol-3-phosphate dehydrogenase/oxidase [Planctomycetota bacterium]